MANLNLLERRRSDGSIVLVGKTWLPTDPDRCFPDWFDLASDRVVAGRWPAVTVDAADGEVRFEYANARATYKITGPLQVPLFDVPEPPSLEALAEAEAEGRTLALPEDTVKFHENGYWYEERPKQGIHIVLVPESVELFDAPPIDIAKRDALRAAAAEAAEPTVPGPDGAGYSIPADPEDEA